MRRLLATPYLIIAFLFTSFVTVVSCAHDDDDELLASTSAAKIERGTDVIKKADNEYTFDKQHSNVMWETAYMGAGALLTGRFNMFGFTSFSFDEANPANTSFEAWVQLNTVNTGEPGRDGVCILKDLGTALGKVNEPENLAVIKTKKVELSPSDKGYIVTMDLIFLGKTKELKGKLSYIGKTKVTKSSGQGYLTGFSLEFQFFAKSDFGMTSTNIADKVGVQCNAQFYKPI